MDFADLAAADFFGWTAGVNFSGLAATASLFPSVALFLPANFLTGAFLEAGVNFSGLAAAAALFPSVALFSPAAFLTGAFLEAGFLFAAAFGLVSGLSYGYTKLPDRLNRR